MSIRNRSLAALTALAALGLLAASLAAAAPAVKGGAVVKLRKTALGSVLVDARGRTLYLYTPDRRNTSACYGKCASFWPPLLTGAKPRAAGGALGKLLGETMRKDGRHQVTYAGHPLYLFVKDRKAGQVNGQGLQSIWYVVSRAGRKVTKAAAPAPAPTPAETATVSVASTSLGKILVAANGMTLYLYTPDTGTTSTCYGGCATAWPPLTVSGKPVAGTGADASLLGTTTRTDGTTQVTYAGHPLYLFAHDAKAGDTNGQGLQGVWFVLSPSGDRIGG